MSEQRQFTAEEIANMRTIVAQHDKQEIREFDLNNPPTKPYKFQEFPKAVYHPDGRIAAVKNPEDETEALDAGWSLNLGGGEKSNEPAAESEVEEVMIKPPAPRRGRR